MSGPVVKTCARVANVLVDAEVRLVYQYYQPVGETVAQRAERKAQALQRLVSEFEEFVRDHRSMDWVQLSVERVVQDQCSACGNEWEPDNDNGRIGCAHCDAEVTS